MSFGREEKEHILKAVAVLSFAFTLILLRARIQVFWALGIALVAVLTGFLLHELAHKYTAQHYGCWAEFRAWDMGLLLALISGFAGFLFAAPGAVYISGVASKRENGIISAAGPATNLMVGVVFLIILRLLGGLLPPPLFLIFWFASYINIFLGFFNMLPIPPLDGSKVIAWDPGVYLALMVPLAFLLFILAF
ncbi:MAG: site-2 protease family protein [Thermoplasmata archaeon]|nr:site-2 protease family protein [Thermoplasmata archaeon]